MKLKYIALIFFVISCLWTHGNEIRYVGGDISCFPTYEEAGVVYKDENGNRIEFLPYLYDIGMNAMRVRLFVDPESFEKNHPDDYDPNACQSLPYIIPLCRDIIENGFDLMLDFHYSDTWADPDDQWIPDSWSNLTDKELEEKIYQYTSDTLIELRQNGIVPKFIQPGNEISYGMLWGEYGNDIPGNHAYTNSPDSVWQRFGEFLNSAIKACRKECPDAEIIIHTERVAQVVVLTNFYQRMETIGIDYDIIGLSYYPAYHGNLSQLDTALSTIEKTFKDKPIMIVETGYPLYWDIEDTIYSPEFGLGSMEQQNHYAEELVKLLLQHKAVNGLFWWWLDYNPYISDSEHLSKWWNAPLIDPYTGKVLPATRTLASFGTGNASVKEMKNPQISSDIWYDINGKKIAPPQMPGIYIHDGKKILVK